MTRERLGYRPKQTKPTNQTTSPTRPKPPEDVVYWKDRAQDFSRRLEEIHGDSSAAKILAERIIELAPHSYQTLVPARPIEPTHESSPQSAVLLLSDTHIGACVTPEQTLGLGGYSFDLFLRRLEQLERSIFSIIQHHTVSPVSEIVIPILGDMLDGALVHAVEAGQVNTMLEQFYSGGHALAQFLMRLSVLAPLRIYGCVGNHTRWQNQKKMPAKNRNSNYDMLLYLYIQALTRENLRMEWRLDWQPFATFEVQGFQFYAGHGENIRGGDRILGLPAHGLGRMVSTTTQLFTRAKRAIPAYYCLGHLHRPIEIPHANGEIIINGAFPGIDSYALAEYFNSSLPSQKFFLVHPKYGRSAEYNMRLDLGDDTPSTYQIPTSFLCK